MKYYTTITGWGDMALDYLEDENNRFMVLFDEGAPEELKEVSVLHRDGSFIEAPQKGDTVIIFDKAYDITAIGYEAPRTLKELGHCTLSFMGGDEPDRPGTIMLEGPPLTKEDFRVGGTIEVY